MFIHIYLPIGTIGFSLIFLNILSFPVSPLKKIKLTQISCKIYKLFYSNLDLLALNQNLSSFESILIQEIDLFSMSTLLFSSPDIRFQNIINLRFVVGMLTSWVTLQFLVQKFHTTLRSTKAELKI